MKHEKRVEIFKDVQQRYEGFLTSVLWKLTADADLFADAMQNALLRMWRHVEKLNGCKAQAYIYRIALSANSTAWRNRIGKDGQIACEPVSPPADGSQSKVDLELAHKVRRRIARLPSKQAKAIVMRYLEEKDYQIIAEELSCSPAGARSHVSKALATLKRKLCHE